MKKAKVNHKELKIFKEKVREAVADYMTSEGCSCCQNIDEHTKHKKVLAKLLDVAKYGDGSGYDFYKFNTESKSKASKEKIK